MSKQRAGDTDFKPMAAAFAIAELARKHPKELLRILASSLIMLAVFAAASTLPKVVPQTAELVASLVAIPIGLLAFAAFVLGMPVAIIRLSLTGKVEGRIGLTLDGSAMNFAISLFCIHFFATLGALPSFLVAMPVIMLANIESPGLLTLPIAFVGFLLLFAGYAYVQARLGPALALLVFRKRLLVTRTWRPTKTIRWALLLAWAPWWVVHIGISLPAFLFPSPAAQFSLDPGLLAGTGGLLIALTLLIAMAASTQAYVAKYLLAQEPDLGVEAA